MRTLMKITIFSDLFNTDQ